MAKKKNNNTKVNEEKKNKNTKVSEEKEVKATKEVVKAEKVKKEKKEKKDKKENTNVEPKKSLWIRFRIFCHGVVSETKKVHWAGKDTIIKYSIATIAFVIFLALFFYCIDTIFAAIQTLFK